MSAFVKVNAAADLPVFWDECAGSYFQRRKFLSYAESWNPCHQRYYMLITEGKLLAGACVYTLKIDLFTFSGIKSPVTMHVTGVPASVSCPGIIGDLQYWNVLMEKVLESESGLILMMNLPPNNPLKAGTQMKTLPTIEIDHNFKSWEDYYTHLRSNYRLRFKRIISAFPGLTCMENDCSAFSDDHYDLYLQIMARTKTRLEKLNKEFFVNLPPEFRLVSLYDDGILATWHISLAEDQQFVFLYGGTNYKVNRKLNAYYNNLFRIVKEAVSMGFKQIELGQTAEIPKMRLGGRLIGKNMVVYHNNKMIRCLIKIFKPLIEYKRTVPDAHVFRD